MWRSPRTNGWVGNQVSPGLPVQAWASRTWRPPRTNGWVGHQYFPRVACSGVEPTDVEVAKELLDAILSGNVEGVQGGTGEEGDEYGDDDNAGGGGGDGASVRRASDLEPSC